MNRNDFHQQELSLFTAPPTDTSLQSREWIEYRPTNQISDTSAIDFNIAAQSSAYVDLKRSVLHVKLRLTDADGTPIQDDIHPALINLPLHTIFRQVDVSFQQTPLSQTGANYPYKAYIETLLKSDEGTQQGLLSSQMFYKDTGDLDTNDALKGSNAGLFFRCSKTKAGATVDLEGPLLLDLFQQPKLLLNGVSIGIKLWPSLNAFRLMSNTINPSEKVQIVDARFRLCIQRLNAAVLIAHEKIIQDTPAIYPYLRSEVRTTSIAAGQYSFSADDIFQGQTPSKLIIGFVSSASYMGQYSRNPFNFRHYNCTSVGMYIDGQSFPAMPIQTNFSANHFVEAYRTLSVFRNDVNISREDYKKGYCLYALDIDPYHTFNTKRKGHCRLELKFGTALPESVTLILYATFPEVLSIDKARAVYIR